VLFAGTRACVAALGIGSGLGRAKCVRCFDLSLQGREIWIWASCTNRVAKPIHDGHLQHMAHGCGMEVLRSERPAGLARVSVAGRREAPGYFQ
jgi:hypothetical protein